MSEVSAQPENSKRPENAENSVEASNRNDRFGEPTVANDVQRAIEGLKDIPDDELQEFLDDEDFMKGLDVVDAWEGNEDRANKDCRPTRLRDRDDKGDTKASRDRSRRERKSPSNRERQKREEKKREDIRRDPSKSSKDIERDKIRTKKDSDSKMLAEKEKAIKHLLDSDNVVPPGTEVEVIQDITEKQQNAERGAGRSRKSRERRRSPDRQRPSPVRRRSNDRIRLSPHRRISDERRQIRTSPDRRRNIGSPSHRRSGSRPRRPSWERRASRDRSIERHRRREEREQRLAARRSRSRERQRSRSIDRYRKRWSRSPAGRRSSPRRHSRSRSPDRRTRKRSPFINEITRQFRKEDLIPSGPPNPGFMPPPLMSMPPLMGPGFPQDQASPVPPPPMPPFMHHPGPPGPSGMHMQSGPPFVNFDPCPPHGQLGPPMNYEPGPMHQGPQPDYISNPIMYNQPNPPGPIPQPGHGPVNLPMPMISPQPVPAPGPTDHTSMNFNQPLCVPNVSSNSQLQHQHLMEKTNRRPNSPMMSYSNHKSTTSSSYNGTHPQRSDRLKTPEPPVISNSKPFEKTSLSSLLEASVSAKDSVGLPVLYPGFNPEILRHCELALRDLPAEDLRLKMKGRFFFDPCKEDPQPEPEEVPSNSILLRTGRNKIYWEEAAKVQITPEVKPIVETHQKICQTDVLESESKSVQASISVPTADFCMQVYPYDLQHAAKEDKRPIMDRLDWNMRETYDYAPKIRDSDDLRWSLSNSSQKRSWNRGISPTRVLEEERVVTPDPLRNLDHGSRGNYSFHRSSSREHYGNERYSPNFHGSIDAHEEFQESRSDHSRGESPMVLEDSPEVIDIEQEHFPRGSEWRPRGKSSYGAASGASHKMRPARGKNPVSRTHRGRGGYRGKF